MKKILKNISIFSLMIMMTLSMFAGFGDTAFAMDDPPEDPVPTEGVTPAVPVPAEPDGVTIIIASNNPSGLKIAPNQSATDAGFNNGVMSFKKEITNYDRFAEFWAREVKGHFTFPQNDDYVLSNVRVYYSKDGQNHELATYQYFLKSLPNGQVEEYRLPTTLSQSIPMSNAALAMKRKRGVPGEFESAVLKDINQKCLELREECKASVFVIQYEVTPKWKFGLETTNNNLAPECRAYPVLNGGCQDCPPGTTFETDGTESWEINNFDDFYGVLQRFKTGTQPNAEFDNSGMRVSLYDEGGTKLGTKTLEAGLNRDQRKSELRSLYDLACTVDGCKPVSIKLEGICPANVPPAPEKVSVKLYDCFDRVVLATQADKGQTIDFIWGGKSTPINTATEFRAKDYSVCPTKIVIEKDKCDVQLSSTTVKLNYDGKLEDGTNTFITPRLRKTVAINLQTQSPLIVKEDGVCSLPTFKVKFIDCNNVETTMTFNQTQNADGNVKVRSPWGTEYTVNQNTRDIVVREENCKVNYVVTLIDCNNNSVTQNHQANKGETITIRAFGKEYRINKNETIRQTDCPKPNKPPVTPPTPESDEEYTVKFLDCNGKVISEQVVKSGSHAVAPKKYRYNPEEFSVVWENKTIKPIMCHKSVNTSDKTSVLAYVGILTLAISGLSYVIYKKKKETA